MQICQGVVATEVELLDLVKDQKLLDKYPTLADVLESFLPGWKKPEVKKQSRAKKSLSVL
jgi:hypothetical protein